MWRHPLSTLRVGESGRCGELPFPFPPSERAPVLAGVKARGLDTSCDPVAEKASGSGAEEWRQGLQPRACRC